MNVVLPTVLFHAFSAVEGFMENVQQVDRLLYDEIGIADVAIKKNA